MEGTSVILLHVGKELNTASKIGYVAGSVTARIQAGQFLYQSET
jgi:hypothetical protein